MFERILWMDSWKTFCLPFLFKVLLARLFYLLKILYNIIFSLWRFTNWLWNISWNWNSIFLGQIYFESFGSTKKYDIRYTIAPLYAFKSKISQLWWLCVLYFTLLLKDIEQINCQFVDAFLCALGFCFRGGLNVVTMAIIKIITTIKRCNNLNRL